MRNNQIRHTSISRRDMLHQSAAGFGAIGLASAFGESALGESALGNSILPGQHFPARAKRVIFLFMNGAPSHVDTFDPKPALLKHEGEKPKATSKYGF